MSDYSFLHPHFGTNRLRFVCAVQKMRIIFCSPHGYMATWLHGYSHSTHACPNASFVVLCTLKPHHPDSKKLLVVLFLSVKIDCQHISIEMKIIKTSVTTASFGCTKAVNPSVPRVQKIKILQLNVN